MVRRRDRHGRAGARRRNQGSVGCQLAAADLASTDRAATPGPRRQQPEPDADDRQAAPRPGARVGSRRGRALRRQRWARSPEEGRDPRAPSRSRPPPRPPLGPRRPTATRAAERSPHRAGGAVAAPEQGDRRSSHSLAKPFRGGSAADAAAPTAKASVVRGISAPTAERSSHGCRPRPGSSPAPRNSNDLNDRVVEAWNRARGQCQPARAAQAVRWWPSATPTPDEDDADVLDAVIGEQALEIVLHQGVEHAEHRGDRPDAAPAGPTTRRRRAEGASRTGRRCRP